jgi:hypothetical protein
MHYFVTPRSDVPDKTKPADRTRVLSVRLTSEELDALTARATEVGVGPSTLARTLVRRGLGIGSADPANPTTLTSPRDRTGGASDSPSALEAQLVAGLVARVEALERWAAEH